MSDYQTFLADLSGDIDYTLGCRPEWERLQMIVDTRRYPEDGGYASIELSLTPAKARKLAQALLAAAWYLEKKQVTA